MHHYSDEQLHDILEIMWKEGDEVGILKGKPELVRRYIPSGLVPLEDEARLLRDQAKMNLIMRLNVQEG